MRSFIGYSRLPVAEDLEFPVTTLPHARIAEEPAAWNIYEIPHPNVGNYSPTEVVMAGSGAEIMTILGKPEFEPTSKPCFRPRSPNSWCLPARCGCHALAEAFMFRAAAMARRWSCCRSNSQIACVLATSACASCVQI